MQENQTADHSTKVVDPYARSEQTIQEPPQSFLETLRHLGPGMILVGSIVGSGELIMTTKLGAEAGFVLLWFVLLSCLIKVVVQAELVRHTISSGQTFLTVFNTLPGPCARRPVWLNLEWLAVVVVTFFLGLAAYTTLNTADKPAGEAAGSSVILYATLLASVIAIAVGWACWISFRHRRTEKLQTDPASKLLERPTLNWFMWLWLSSVLLTFINGGAILGGAGQAMELAFRNFLGPTDARYWTIAVALASIAVLLSGSYKTLERVSVGLVATFTLITILCTCLLQWTDFAITPADLRQGLTFDLPGPELLTAGLILTALGMYAGTGIGTSEMMSYTYWCVEKGYARNTGNNQPGTEWPRRARGWIRVMYTDVFLTMIVYTISTVCFYFLGAAILFEMGLSVEGTKTLEDLGNIYTESLGNWAATLFVVGGFFVLFSTILSGVAGGTRTLADGLCVLRIIDPEDYPARWRFTRILVVVSLALYALMYALFENPPVMLVISSMISVALYPVLGLGTLYLRYRAVDSRILPTKFTTFWLWVCGLALALISPAAALFALAIQRGWIVLSG